MSSIDGCVNVQCPFGEKIIADVEVEYTLDGRELFDHDICPPVCIGIIIVDPHGDPSSNRQYVAFTTQAGLEHHFADAIAEACATTWKGRIRDACQQNAEQRKLLSA